MGGEGPDRPRLEAGAYRVTAGEILAAGAAVALAASAQTMLYVSVLTGAAW
jgi:hypothetical protein